MARSLSLSINYDPAINDLKAKLMELKNLEGSRYEGRSLSEIGRILLLESLPGALATELAKLSQEPETPVEDQPQDVIS